MKIFLSINEILTFNIRIRLHTQSFHVEILNYSVLKKWLTEQFFTIVEFGLSPEFWVTWQLRRSMFSLFNSDCARLSKIMRFVGDEKIQQATDL